MHAGSLMATHELDYRHKLHPVQFAICWSVSGQARLVFEAMLPAVAPTRPLKMPARTEELSSTVILPQYALLRALGTSLATLLLSTLTMVRSLSIEAIADGDSNRSATYEVGHGMYRMKVQVETL